MKIKMYRKPDVEAQHPWPEGTFLQGGDKGVVLSNKPEGNYTTAFVETHSEVTGFIRGEGKTVAEAEDDCWAKAQQTVQCPGHVYEARGYKNGGGVCIHCKRFKSGAFTPEQLGLFCAACGVPTFWHAEHFEPVGEFFTCPLHVPHRDGSWCFCPPCEAARKAEEPLTDEEMTAGFEALFRSLDG